ncbi:MAG: ABC transporter permease [Thermoproteota archaeon]
MNFERVKTRIYLFWRYFTRWFMFKLFMRYYWIEWILPFHVINLTIGVLTYVYFARSFQSSSAFYQQYGGDFLSFLILGIMLNGLLLYTLDAYRLATLSLFRTRLGSGGQQMGVYDYLKLSGTPLSAHILAEVLDGYLEEFISLLVYLLVGLLIGLKIQGGNYVVAILGILLGLLATTGIGLISASMITIIGAWKGVEPIRWLVGLLNGLVSGVYFPVEVLPKEIQDVSLLLPQTYTLKIVRLALLRNFGIGELIPEFAVLLVMAFFFFLAGIILYKYSIDLLKVKTFAE